MNGETDSERGEKKKRVLCIWLQVPPCSVAPLKHTITQSRAIIRQRERKEGERQTERRPILRNTIQSKRSAFTRAVITAAHSVHLTSPLDSLSSRFSVIHGVLAQSTWVCLSGWNNRIHLRKQSSGTPMIAGKHPRDVTITAACFDTRISSGSLEWSSRLGGLSHRSHDVMAECGFVWILWCHCDVPGGPQRWFISYLLSF